MCLPWQVMSQAQGELEEERRRLLGGLSSLLGRYRGRVMERPGFDEERALLAELDAARDSLERCLRSYASKLDGSWSLSKEVLSKARLEHLTCDVAEVEEVLGVPLSGIGNGLCSRRGFPSHFGDLNGHHWGSCGGGSMPQDDQIPVRDVGPLSETSQGSESMPKLPLVFRDTPPTCSTPIGTPRKVRHLRKEPLRLHHAPGEQICI